MAQIDTWLSTVNRNNTKKIQGKKKKRPKLFRQEPAPALGEGRLRRASRVGRRHTWGLCRAPLSCARQRGRRGSLVNRPLNFAERPVLPRVGPSVKNSSPRAFQYRAADARRTRSLPRAWLRRRPLSAKEDFADTPGARRLYCFR